MSPAKWYARQRARLALAEGERRRTSGDIDAAVAAFEQAAALDSFVRRKAIDAAASLLIEHGRLSEAIPRLQRLVEIDKADIASWRRLARALVRTGERKLGIKAWRRVQELVERDLEANEALAGLLPEGSPESVEPLRVVAVAGDDKAVWARLGRTLTGLSRAGEASAAWRRVLALDPQDLEAHAALAALLEGDHAEAVIHLRTIADKRPEAAESWRALARALTALGDQPAAVTPWRRVLASSPDDLEAHGALAQLLAADPAEAVVHLRALAKARPEAADVWRALGQALTALGDRDEAVHAWRRLLKLDRGDVEAHAALAGLLDADPAAAVVHLRAVTDANPDSVAARKALGRGLVAVNDNAGAAAAWRRVLKLDKDDIESHAALAELLGGRDPAALLHLEVLAERGPDPVSARRRLGELFERTGDFPRARKAFERLLEVAPDDQTGHERLAHLRAEAGDAAGAARHLRRLAELSPDRDRPWRRLAQALRDQEDGSGEADAWRRVLALLPQDLQAHERLAALLTVEGRLAEAAQHLKAVAEADPTKIKAWKRYARALEELGQGAEAFQVWRRVLEIDAADPHAHDRMAELLTAQGFRARALVHLRALAGAGGDRHAWRRLARALGELSREEEAIAAWRRVLELAPGEYEAHTALVELLAADPAQAAPHWRAASEATPKKPEVWRGLAKTLTAVGDTGGAIEAWRRLLKLDEQDVEAHEALADLLGDRKSASLPHLRVLAERGPDLAGARRRLAQLLDKAGDAPGARTAWQSLLEIAPDEPAAHERLAQLLAAEGVPAAAEAHLRWLAMHGVDRLRGYRRLAQSFRDRGDAEGEIAVWRELQAASPQEIAPHEQLAMLLDSLGRKAEAAAHHKALAELQPGQVKPWKRAAKALEEAGDAAAALEAWDRVLAADAEDPHAHDEAARLLEGLGRPAEAARRLLESARRDPADVRRWRRLAGCLQDAADAAGEIDAWRRVLELDQGSSQAHERLAVLLESRGDRAGAAVHVRALAEADAGRSKSWRRLATLLDAAGDAEGALEAWARISGLEPSDLFAHERQAQLLIDLGRPAEAAGHLRTLAGADPGKAKGWRRLALTLADAGQAEAEMEAWGHLLAAEDGDLQAHERLAMLLTEAGREAEALAHLQAVVRLAPENARGWRRYARALKRADAALGELEVWRDTVALAGYGELANQLNRSAEAQTRNQDLKQELQGVGAELKRERAATHHALARLEREERAHRATHGLLKDELAERRRLTAELQESTQRQRQAEAEEARHLIAGRLIGLLEPLAGAEAVAAAQADEAAAYAEESLRAAAAAGALVAAGEAEGRLAGVDVTSPDDLTARLRGRTSRLVVLADRNPAARAQIRAVLASRRGLAMLDLDQLVIRRAAGLENLKVHVEPVSDDVWPPRPLMIMCADDSLREAVVEAVGKATDLAIAPLFPITLAARVQARELDLDDWLAAAWSARGRPRAFGFQFDAETLALFAREIRAGRAPVMAKVFRRATALHLAWSDKALHAAADHFARSGEEAASDFDAGDAQIEVKTYKRLIARDMLLENGFEQLGKFRPATAKAYRELFDKPALGRFCRDAGLSLAVAGFAQVEERALAFMPSPEVVRAGRLIGEAVRSLTAAREPEAPPQGLVQYGLGRSLEALGRHAEALEAYQEAVVRAPTYFPARAAAARYLELAGRPAEAERLLRQALGNGTPDQDVQEGLLDFYQRNASPQGVAAVSRLMRRRGQIRAAIAAPALIELGRWREAEPLLETISARISGQDNFLNDFVDLPRLAGELPTLESGASAGDAAAQLRLAEALRRLGRLRQALPWYRRALADPSVLEAEVGVGAEFRPQFLMVGPPRTGTTLLRRLFDLHPQIAAPSGELFFFSSRTGQRAGSNRQRAPLSWYLGAFKAAAERKPDARLIGEKTPHYFSTSDEQMAFASLLLPQVKIIATLRDPVVRAWSEIKVQRRATEAEIVAALSEGERPNWLSEILDAGRYAAHLRRWLKHVTPDRLLLVDSDALESQVVEEAGRIFRWLGVKDLPRKQVMALQQGWNNRTESFSPSAQVEALLRRSYEGEPWTASDVGRAIGLGEVVALPPGPRPQRRRASAK